MIEIMMEHHLQSGVVQEPGQLASGIYPHMRPMVAAVKQMGFQQMLSGAFASQ
jgi:hypothetical protein